MFNITIDDIEKKILHDLNKFFNKTINDIIISYIINKNIVIHPSDKEIAHEISPYFYDDLSNLISNFASNKIYFDDELREYGKYTDFPFEIVLNKRDTFIFNIYHIYDKIYHRMLEIPPTNLISYWNDTFPIMFPIDKDDIDRLIENIKENFVLVEEPEDDSKLIDDTGWTFGFHPEENGEFRIPLHRGGSSITGKTFSEVFLCFYYWLMHLCYIGEERGGGMYEERFWGIDESELNFH